jgi:hypothetical protein
MKPIEIVNAIKEDNAKLLGKLPDKKVAQIISAALKHIKLEVSTAGKGRVAVSGLGVFVVKSVEREINGEKRMVERVVFRMPKGKQKAESTEA